MKTCKTIAMTKIKAFAYRKKTIYSFANMLKTLGKSKELQWKSLAFNNLKLPLIHHKGIEGSMNKLNEILNPKSSVPVRREPRSSSSAANLLMGESKVSVGSRSTSRIQELEKKQNNTIQ